MQIKITNLLRIIVVKSMHRIFITSDFIRTDLITEQKDSHLKKKIHYQKGLKIEETTQDKNHYTTIFFEDISDQDCFQNVQTVFVEELKKYLNVGEGDTFLVVGLGNQKSTPDSLGPDTIEHILVTRYLFLLGEVEEGYGNVSSFSPNVMGNTGIETSSIIKSIIEETKVNKVILIDALKTNSLERLGKTIQITDKGIAPGSGMGNIRKEISPNVLNVEVIAIGVPTVVDLRNIDSVSCSNHYMVTPTDIDFLIEKLALLIGNGINISIHKNFIRQNYS